VPCAFRYAEYLAREDKLGAVRKGLELTSGVLRSGRVRPEYLHDPLRPSAPLRAFSYTQAGGQQSCGERSQINAVFKCPDGYAGGWNYGPGEQQITDGYDDLVDNWDGNPLCAPHAFERGSAMCSVACAPCTAAPTRSC
jgi:hypothetical protein